MRYGKIGGVIDHDRLSEHPLLVFTVITEDGSRYGAHLEVQPDGRVYARPLEPDDDPSQEPELIRPRGEVRP